MSRNVSPVALGSSLLLATVVLAIAGYISLMGVNNSIMHAVMRAPDDHGYDQLLLDWSNLILPLLFCLVGPIVVFLFGSMMAYRGDLKISYRAPNQPSAK